MIERNVSPQNFQKDPPKTTQSFQKTSTKNWPITNLEIPEICQSTAVVVCQDLMTTLISIVHSSSLNS